MVTGDLEHEPLLALGASAPDYVMLVIHGFGMYDELYADAVEKIVGDHGRALIFNLPGHGRWSRERRISAQISPARVGAFVTEAVEAALAASVPVVVLGESLGCAYALRVATSLAVAGNAPAGVVLLAPPLVLRPTTVTRWIVRSMRDIRSSGYGRVRTTEAMREMVGDAALAARFVEDGNIQHSVPLAYVAQSCVDVARMYVDLPKLTMPLLVMSGARDPLVDPVSVSTAIALARSRTKTGSVVASAGHGLFWDEHTPAVVNRIQEWLAIVVGEHG